MGERLSPGQRAEWRRGLREQARGVVPPGTYAGGARSPIVYVMLCPVCAGYAPSGDEGASFGRCCGCGSHGCELHRFQALILSAANGGCHCIAAGHPQVHGDLPTEESANAVLLEVRTRPPQLPCCGRIRDVKRFWRFLTRPVVSVADAALMASCVAAADAMHLGLHLAWGWILVIVWGVTIGFVFGIGFVRGFCRSVAADVKRWRAARGS